MSRALEEAFIRNKIPYQIVRGVEFYNRKEIRDLLAYLKILVNPDDEIALLRIINTPARGIGKTTINRIRNYADSKNISFFQALRKTEHIDSLPKAAKARLAVFVNLIEQLKKDIDAEVAPLAERVFIESGLEESLRSAEDGKDALENIGELISAAAQYDRQAEEPSLLDYLQQISLFSDTDSYDTADDRIALMTLHAAKGLEFENVLIIGLEEGLLPHERSGEDDDEIEEERRLFFVGITRSKAGLYISYARYRTVRGQMLRTIPSQFLYELGTDLVESEDQQQTFDDYTDDVDRVIPDFVKNQLVRHKTFGLGRVSEFIDMGQDSIIIVRFNTGQTKTLMLKYASLWKVQNY